MSDIIDINGVKYIRIPEHDSYDNIKSCFYDYNFNVNPNFYSDWIIKNPYHSLINWNEITGISYKKLIEDWKKENESNYSR